MFSDERNSRIDYYDTLNLGGLLAQERESPHDVDLLVLIGRHYLREGQLDRSHAYYSKALAIDPNDGWTYIYMGNLCYALACYDEAEAHFKRAIELLPGIACPIWCLADVYAKQGYWSRTEEQYRRAVDLDPTDIEAREKLNSWLAARRDQTHNS